jgi:hypothetical protein
MYFFFALEGQAIKGEEKIHSEELQDLYSSVLITKHYSNDQIKKHGMGGSCSTYGGEVHTESWCGNLREREHVGELRVEWRIILKWIFRK